MSDKYYQTKESVDEYIKAAEGYDGLHLIEQLKPHLSAGSILLEIGSGPGTDWNILRKDFQVTGSDFSMEFISRLQAQNPEAEFLQLDASTLDTNKTFDAIFSNKVLHHLTDEQLQSSFERQHALLNSGGIICHSFWKGTGDAEYGGMYVNYHTVDEVKTLLAGKFETVVLNLYKEFEDDDSIFIIARKA